ncbi:alpha/beta hydrolase family protein [Clostridium felsineum]|uniref:alpha/beta hydrolase family protein n=1 Tax=Clostridium felsineum TaxID=36839 RepID=UPI00098CB377|nr:alpha/beta fold hydrolase [Clostridium felsineum]URZ14428.1 2-succinyl-6-hydroxy-2,4-cyclohexadiene-1-carboxylate synthase [Clostridium felsineum DSM 794]
MQKIVNIKRAGLNLVGTLEYPFLEENKKYPLVIIMHGFTSNRNRKLQLALAEKLLENNIVSLRFDFNGHGDSDGLFEDMTVPNELEDAGEVLRYVKKLDFVKNISLLGHSQGGVVAGMTAGYYPDDITCLVQMAPAATLKDDALKGTIMGTIYDPKHIPEYITITSNNKPLRSQYFSTAQHLPIYEVSSQYKGPVCLIHGTSDKVVDPFASKRYYGSYANSALHLLEKQDHGFEYNLDEAVDLAVNFIISKVN